MKKNLTASGEKHVIYKKTTKRGEGKVGNIMVKHPTKDKGMWDVIDLTKKSGAKTIAQGVASTKKWHKENPYPNMKTNKKQAGGTTKQMGGTKKKVIKSASGNYRAVQKPIEGSPVKNTTGLRRTIKGAIKGAPTVTERVSELRASKTKDPRYTTPAGGALNYIMSKKKGGTVKKYQTGGSTPKTKAMEGQFKNTHPTGKNSLKTGVYRGPKITLEQIKQSQQDWNKKEREMTNPKNRAKGSALTPMKKGGMAKGKLPKGYHMMPNGKLMKDSAHKKSTKK
jgi:hypothetical protein